MTNIRKIQQQIATDFGTGKLKFLAQKSKIRFRCQRSGKCCHHNEVMVSPYDIMEMAKHLKMPSNTFFIEYCTVHIGADSHLPIAMLRQIQTGRCAFLENNSCSIHPAKPKICRAYPLAAGTIVDPKTGKVKEGYFDVPQPGCPGTKANHFITFEQFAKQADLRRYDEGSRPFRHGIQRIIANYRTERLVQQQHAFIIPLLYFPDSVLKAKGDREMPQDAREWSRLGLEIAEKYIEYAVGRKPKTNTNP
jgi:Fe-S-cluster containining protein